MLQVKPKTIEIKSINDEVNLFLISDIHFAQEASDWDLLISDLKDKPQNRIILGVGDELDCISRKDKRHRPEDLKDCFLDKKNYHRLIDAEIDEYAEIIAKYTNTDEWLGHISGNHPDVMTEHGIDPIQSLCQKLKHQYLGYSAFVPLNFRNGLKILNVMIMCHHGFGGTNARKEGSSLNAFIDHSLRYEGWDIAVYGHRHDRWVKMVPRIRPQGGGLKDKTAWVRAIDRCVVQCGTYLRTLSHSDFPTYAEKAGYPPRPLGCVKLKIGMGRRREGEHDNLYLKFISANI